jgi:hypothetical protein
MSRRLPTSRNAAAGVALAAAGVVYRRLTGRKAAQPAEPVRNSADDAEVARARSELAEELARRAGRSER